MTTTRIDPSTTIGQLVAQRPARSRCFEKLGIDYCCGGNKALEKVCVAHGLDLQTVLAQLEKIDANSDPAANGLVDAAAMGLAELADHITRTHHAFLKAELPRLDQMTEKVLRVHGEHEPRLADLRRAFCEMQSEMVPHMMKEEQMLFPMIRAMESSNRPQGEHCGGSIANPIRQMEHEHDLTGDALATMREVTDGFTPPDWACNTYRAMIDGLWNLEQDMHQHVHKENNVLFPRAISMEAELLTTTASPKAS